jgi:hypothetical protein
MSYSLPHRPGRHTSAVDSDAGIAPVRTAKTTTSEAGAPPIFREVMAAWENRPQRVAGLLAADLGALGSRSSGGNGPGYSSSYPAGRADTAGGWAGGRRPGNPWCRVLNP